MTDEIDKSRRRFLVAATTLVGGVGVAGAAVPFLSSWSPSRDTKAAGAAITVDISKLEPGAQMTVEWRGKPIWIIRRTPESIKLLEKTDDQVRDPHSDVEEQQPSYAKNRHRAIREEYLILVGVCTHLGCTPAYRPDIGELGPDWPGGFFCPCHGSRFDLAGRVFKDVPAPINLEVPPHYFVNDATVVIGEDPKTA